MNSGAVIAGRLHFEVLSLAGNQLVWQMFAETSIDLSLSLFFSLSPPRIPSLVPPSTPALLRLSRLRAKERARDAKLERHREFNPLDLPLTPEQLDMSYYDLEPIPRNIFLRSIV